MENNFKSAIQKTQNLMTLYSQLDGLSNRNQWHFEPQYQNGNSCAFVFAHKTRDVSQRYNDLNALANLLYNAGIKASLIAREGLISDVIIDSKYTELARKLFARYQVNNKATKNNNIAQLEQEWLHKTQGNQL